MAEQTTHTILMIRPASFGSNPETAESNAFQRPVPGADVDEIRAQARAEFDGLVRALRAADVEVIVVDDTAEPVTPDAVFPNNWISFHASGTVVLYPMQAPSRRAEVRLDLVDQLGTEHRFEVRSTIDLTEHADHDRFLEGTGSMVLDRVGRVAYAVRSPRTDASVFEEFCRRTEFEPVLFEALDSGGTPVYHANVVMCIGTAFVVICADALRVPRERREVLARLAENREVVEIDVEQMESFAGNLLEVKARDGTPIVVASAHAHDALRAEQRAAIERHATFVTADLDTIERHGGGSARCMLAEVFLPR